MCVFADRYKTVGKSTFGQGKFDNTGDLCMTREKLLELLADLPFAMIWPGSWDDVGFTEREIWVNNKGYGYIMCNEPTGSWEGHGLSQAEWEAIKEKLAEECLSYSDIKNTAIDDILTSMGYEESDFEDDDSELAALLGDLLSLPDRTTGYLAAIQEETGISFYASNAEFRNAWERDRADKIWADMDDELLSTWINRLSVETDDMLIEWAKRNNLP